MLTKLVSLVKDRGVHAASAHLGHRVLSEVDRLRPSQIRGARERAVRERLFDDEHGVNTSGDAQLNQLTITGTHRRFGVNYRGVDPDEFHRGFSRLPIDHEGFTFIDLGAGKGKALLLASRFPFRAVIGVEFAAELHRIAEDNVARYAKANVQSGRLEVVLGDATTYDFPLEPLVIFLYNPFGPEIMQKVAARVRASHTAAPRPIYVLYNNPFQAQVWNEHGFSRVEEGDLYALFQA